LAASKLNGFVLLHRPSSQDTVSRVTAATLLRGFERRVVTIAGLRTRYWVGGVGPPLVLVHGLGGAAWNFTDVAPLLALHHRVLVPDLPGHGGTEPLPQLESLSDLALHVGAVADHENMAPAAVLGYSMGGPVSLRLAVERPEAVSSLVLVAPAGIVSTTRRAEIWLVSVSSLRPARKIARFSRLLARRPNLRLPVFGYWGADDPRLLSPESVVGFLAAQPEHTDVEGAARALLRDDPRPDLGAVTCPTAVVWGARDRLIPLEDGFEYARRLRCPLRVLPAAGHLLVGECSEELAVVVGELLETVAPAAV
jgi:pimeloyl-ACP methyl ester carboxylesterase